MLRALAWAIEVRGVIWIPLVVEPAVTGEYSVNLIIDKKTDLFSYTILAV
jgi:hypothetical protein